MTTARLQTPILPRGLNIRQASAYWGVSPGTFKKLMRLGLVPAPLELPGCERNIFDRVALDRAMDARGNAGGETVSVPQQDTCPLEEHLSGGANV